MRLFLALLLALPGALTGKEQMPLLVGEKELAIYQAAPLSEPKGGDKFKGSNFIHPLKTPSGFVVTDSQPKDHLHHFGLWWPWKFIEVEGRKILCWELQNGDGMVEAQEASALDQGLMARSLYIDRKAPDGPTPRLEEKTRLTTSGVMESPASGYYLDMEITMRVVGNKPVTISKYRYSGLGYRATAAWNKESSTVLTSEDKDRSNSNGTRARWVQAQGKTDSDTMAGVLIMGHPANHDHPEKIRTWNEHYNGAIFVNFNPVMEQAWTFEPGKDYTRRYRLFIYDGTVSKEEADALWAEYASQ
jgi:hypothetical protein